MAQVSFKIKKKKGKGAKKLAIFERLMRKKPSVVVGFPDGSLAYPDGTPVINVAIWNEFGTEDIPERAFFRIAMSENSKKYRIGLVSAGRVAVNSGPKAFNKALTKLGLQAVSDIQDSITTLKTPPNAPTTIKAKSSSNPLLNTGLMRQSVSFDIRGFRGG
jgi:hypothetical protein